ncbi:AAA domain-containing protein [Burkholderia sp. L27(2015)]|uniref:AAA domain-containing protein n=1 Tax=Burkholderia sp. L27(2015) TaxID=1641858 RepID=UPI00131E3055|nr:AAA domain-containing protein [Burkholderia sp. L27(2015)]
MVSIYVCGEDRTQQISDWKIGWSDKDEALVLTCIFPSRKRFIRPISDCSVVPTRELGKAFLRKKGSSVSQDVDNAVIYGERYAAIQYPGGSKIYVHKLDDIEFVSQTTMKDEPIFQYFVAVAQARADSGASADQARIAANVVSQLKRLPSCAETALHAYCTRSNGRQESEGSLIYPFGVNESQLKAVEQAFTSQVSLIEGPPGTGKTQTILNIIANILVREKTVAVLSNNNAAVENVYEKLGKSGFDYLVARLGSKENREDFFARIVPVPSGEPKPAPAIEDIQTILAQLKQLLFAHNTAAQLQAEIGELHIERRYLRQWQQENGVQAPLSLDKYGLSPRKTADLMAYLSHLATKRIGIRDRIELLFNFRILRVRPFDDVGRRQSVFHALQMHYYDTALREKEAALAVCRESLARGNFTALLETLKAGSMKYLKRHLSAHVQDAQTLDSATYKQNFDAFVRRYPIIGSGTHSIVNSIALNAVLDYVIIDEASQQDIVPGILAFGCAKNVVVVGDSRQLAHIPVNLGLAAPADDYDCEKYSLLDSCIGVFKEALPTTLLKEHYRCHPRIIQFCNQQFYDNALVPMTQDGGEEALRLIVTAKGNHARKNTNLRELDSLLKVLDDEGESVWQGEDGRGFIAPFRAQVVLSGTHLPADFVKDTVHKFQGRECDEIVFSTVLDKKRVNQARLDFVDDPRMVNVAVSRAKNRFTLVTGDEVFTTNNGHIAALVRYVEYYADEKQVLRAPVVSAFDLLYKEYDHSLQRLNARLRLDDSRFKSEQIIAQVLREALSEESCRALTFHSQVALNQIASSNNAALTVQEQAFMKNRASCDFVIYFKVGKMPLGVIEVDGGFHEKPEQTERDALKNSILEKSHLPLLRMQTIESRIEEKVTRFLAQWATGIHGSQSGAR